MSHNIDDAPDTPGDAPVLPRWRSCLLTSTPGGAGESGEDAPERLTRHERILEEGRRRGR
ncbi:hypothetical protein [Actinoallomurus acaciae]|uniref:Uncharacterized protein n=1 Tax=Actinoallomurus acaciae TaxID=502577 RepID=A0ABV5YWP9_9ACTN